MAVFKDLPLDLLPPIIANDLLEPVHVASICLVNHTFHTFAVPKLYERIFVYAWRQQSSKLRVCDRLQLFSMISPEPLV